MSTQTPPYTRLSSPKHSIVDTDRRSLTRFSLQTWNQINKFIHGEQCIIDGESLHLAGLVAVANYGTSALLSTDEKTRNRIDDSVSMLKDHLKSGHLVYGVSTGFGGSANTRTSDLEALQRALIQHQNSGLLTSRDIGRPQTTSLHLDSNSNSMPTSWVRASMLARCNSIIRGHSAVRISVAETILQLLNKHIIPVVPLKGSISASGDLSPLSYIAGAMEGSSDIYVRSSGSIVTAAEALRDAGIDPVVLGPKEGLGLLNGTAFSTATASLALHAACDIVLLSQILTAMSVEALQGSAESFWPQIAVMRPHPGQIEAASNILSFLQGSRFATCVGSAPKDTQVAGLYQDRYALRTASQWIGPQIEDLLLATSQIQTELNSTTDNPLINVESNHILHGGNFQAAIVTSTMDRTRLCLERLGKMLFSQATEIMNPGLNAGLPANLAADDPSLSFTCKGIDINMAAYQSELGFLANPVGNHVQSAEMHNQAINSLALISARYTLQALDMMYLMSAAHFFVLCQALDLRVLQISFLEALESEVGVLFKRHFSDNTVTRHHELSGVIWKRILAVWPTTNTLDLHQRCETTAEAVILDIVRYIAEHDHGASLSTTQLLAFTAQLQVVMTELYQSVRLRLFEEHLSITPTYLGNAAKRMYLFIRKDLAVGFHRGLVEHPTQPLTSDQRITEPRKTIGSRISVIYEALKDVKGSLAIMECAKEGLKQKEI